MIKHLITKPIMKAFKKALPKISQTEQEALDAGEVWWDGNLFSGQVSQSDWLNLISVNPTQLTNEEQAFITGPLQDLCEMIDDWKITHDTKTLPDEVWDFLAEHRFFSFIIPKEYGGHDFSNYAHSLIIQTIATRSISTAVTVMVPNSLGPGKLIMYYGTEEQKQHYLPRLARHEEIPAFALTSPKAGSDAGGIPDTGIVEERDGKIGIRLNWDKRYITLGPICTVLGLAFKLYDPNKLLASSKSTVNYELNNEGFRGITVALIPTDMAGIDIGARHNTLDMAFMNGPNQGKDVFIPLDYIVGGEENVGKGWKMLVECLTVGRSISLPSLGVAAGKLSSFVAGAYSRVRHQFKLPIAKFKGVEEALAKIAGYTYMMKATENLTLAALDNGIKPSVVSAIVKYHMTEMGRKCVNHAMDILGGAGICQGPKNLIANMYKSIPISITVEGANILTRTMMIFGQGAMRCHPFVLKEIKAVSDNDLNAFHDAFWGHVRYFFKNMGKSFFHRLTGGLFFGSTMAYNNATDNYITPASIMSYNLAFASDIAMLVLGGKLKREERLSGRLGDVLSNLYMLSGCIHEYARCAHQVPNDNALMEWGCKTALFEAQEAMDDFIRNFPNKWIGMLLRLIIFPLGKPHSRPDDELEHRVAEYITWHGRGRDRLTDTVFISETPDDKTRLLYDGLEQATISQRRHAQQEEGVLLKHLTDKIIEVDHFKRL